MRFLLVFFRSQTRTPRNRPLWAHHRNEKNSSDTGSYHYRGVPPQHQQQDCTSKKHHHDKYGRQNRPSKIFRGMTGPGFTNMCADRGNPAHLEYKLTPPLPCWGPLCLNSNCRALQNFARPKEASGALHHLRPSSLLKNPIQTHAKPAKSNCVSCPCTLCQKNMSCLEKVKPKPRPAKPVPRDTRKGIGKQLIRPILAWVLQAF